MNRTPNRSVPIFPYRWAAWVFRVSLCSILYITLSGCSEPTIGQQFRDIVAEIDAKCRKDGLGPYLSEDEPLRSQKRTDGSCEILKIKPVDPMATEEGRFAYSIKLPPPHDEPEVEYKEGMSAEAYFNELCEKEAGEWIFKTVEEVEGVFLARNLNTNLSSPGYSALVFHTREAGSVSTHRMEDTLVQPNHGRYNYLERPIDTNETGGKFVRYFRGPEVVGHHKIGTQKNQRPVYVPYIVNKEQTNTLRSRYALTWRQYVDSNATESGIVGSELIVFDRTTDGVLAFKRFFVRFWPRPDSRMSRLTNRATCYPGTEIPEFIQRVLVPTNPAE